MIPSKEQKQQMLDEYINSIKDIVEIRLPKISGISIDVYNQSTEYATLCHRSDKGFYISTSGSWYSPNQAKDYAVRLTFLAQIADKLNKLYAPLK